MSTAQAALIFPMQVVDQEQISSIPGDLSGGVKGMGFGGKVGKEWLIPAGAYQMGLGLHFVFTMDKLTLLDNTGFRF